MDHILLTHDKLDVGKVNDLVADATCGAISLFVGTTRDNFDGKKVLTLEYEAYEPMAMKEMKAICAELRTRWSDIVHIAMYHRLGVVPVCEASVIIAVSSPHRQSALEAVALAMEQLKKRVPIWKKERYENQDSEWKENKESAGNWSKRRQLNVFNCKIDDEHNVSSNLIQIAVEQQELQRRIQCFVEKKREEIDLHNILDYTMHGVNTQDTQTGSEAIEAESTCARTNSTVVKQEGSKCHLKVQRVANRIGPQVKPDYFQTLDKLMDGKVKNEPMDTDLSAGNTTNNYLLQQRIACIEDYLSVPKQSSDIKQRLKDIENRLLYLESISPEYIHFLQQTNNNTTRLAKSVTANKPKAYTSNELNEIVTQLELRKQQQNVKIKTEICTELNGN